MMDDEIRTAAAAVRRQLEEKVNALRSDPAMAEALRLQKALNTMEELTGEPKTTLAQLFGLDGNQAATPSASVRPDEFYGLDQLEAAKRYLRKFTQARHFNEIVNAIRAGGGAVTNENVLRVSLGKSNLDVAKINDYYGMKDNYRGQTKRGKRVISLRPSDQISDDDEGDPEGGDSASPVIKDQDE